MEFFDADMASLMISTTVDVVSEKIMGLIGVDNSIASDEGDCLFTFDC